MNTPLVALGAFTALAVLASIVINKAVKALKEEKSKKKGL